MSALLDAAKTAYTVLRVILALAIFALTKHTGVFPYLGMRRLHVRTRGRSSALLASVLATGRNSRPPGPVRGCLGALDAADVSRLADAISRDGYVVFETGLEPALCDALEEFARTTPATMTPAPADGSKHTYDPRSPLATRYDFDEQELLRHPPVQRLAVDPTIRAVAHAYLRAVPVNDLVAMWWTVAHGEVSSAAAQMFHYDLDRTRFLKFFFYLSDVEADTGPHVFVRGSHRERPAGFFQDRRFTDDEVAAAFPPETVMELTGRRGTIMAVDTSGLHKGKHPDHGDRLVLQIEYSVSLFGAEYTELPRTELLPEVLAEVTAAPRSFSRLAR